jgi:hypothetical protein
MRMTAGAVRRAVVGVAAALLAACVAKGDIEKHVGRIDESVGTSRNQSILLNIVRASRNEPLYFTSLPGVTGSSTTSLSTGLPTINVGVGQSFEGQTFSLSNSVYNDATSRFDVSLLESKGFYDGLLRPISLPIANLIMHQGFSRSLVFSVLVDRIRITSGQAMEEIRNDPANATDFARFERYLYLAVYYGLTVEAYADAEGKPIGNICFDQALAGPEQQPFVRKSPIRCTHGPTDAHKRANSAELSFLIDGKPQTIEIILRSPYQIFQYLGGIIESGDSVTLYGDKPGTTQGPLLVVGGGNYSDCFAKIAYGGGTWCVPNAGSDNTKKIFQILNQLLALNTSPEDIPVTQSVFITR